MTFHVTVLEHDQWIDFARFMRQYIWNENGSKNLLQRAMLYRHKELLLCREDWSTPTTFQNKPKASKQTKQCASKQTNETLQNKPKTLQNKPVKCFKTNQKRFKTNQTLCKLNKSDKGTRIRFRIKIERLGLGIRFRDQV